MTKFFTHWTFAFVTLFILTYIGLQDPAIKETLRLEVNKNAASRGKQIFEGVKKLLEKDIYITKINILANNEIIQSN